jgi:hypothetical protein
MLLAIQATEGLLNEVLDVILDAFKYGNGEEAPEHAIQLTIGDADGSDYDE